MTWYARNFLGFILPALLVTLTLFNRAEALPSFAVQTGQPCSACHIGAFGPQLTPAGRAFKLFGYVATDGKDHSLPISITSISSFTHNDTAVTPAQHFGPNDNFALDALFLGYDGRLTPSIGAFSAIYFDGYTRKIFWDYLDVRHAWEGKAFDHEAVYGITVNNFPSVQDMWNSGPAWAYPYWGPDYHVSALPAASTLLDFHVSGEVLGAGFYSMIDDVLYLEADAYGGLGKTARQVTGEPGPTGIDSVLPYWRVALQKDWDVYNAEIGAYGLYGRIHPGGVVSGLSPDEYDDLAFDANVQWFPNFGTTTGDALSAHLNYIMEHDKLNSSSVLFGTNASDHLNSFKANASYSIGATYTPTVEYFRLTGSSDEAFWYYGPGNNGGVGAPNSSGFIAELAYSPFGKPDSIIRWGNARIFLQYTDYTEFNGRSSHASDHNILYLNLTLSAAPLH